MKIRIIDTTVEPNVNGTTNLNDSKSLQLINLFITAYGRDITNMSITDKLDFVANELKKYMIRIGRDQLRNQRQIEMDTQLVIDSNFD